MTREQVQVCPVCTAVIEYPPVGNPLNRPDDHCREYIELCSLLDTTRTELAEAKVKSKIDDSLDNSAHDYIKKLDHELVEARKERDGAVRVISGMELIARNKDFRLTQLTQDLNGTRLIIDDNNRQIGHLKEAMFTARQRIGFMTNARIAEAARVLDTALGR